MTPEDSARRLIELARAAAGVELDVSSGSLHWLDVHIGEQRHMWRSPHDELVELLGSYLGECLVALGGRWVTKAGGERAVELEPVGPGADPEVELATALPYVRAERHLMLGKEYSVFGYYVAIARMIGRLGAIEGPLPHVRTVPIRVPLTDAGIERILGRLASFRLGSVRRDVGAWRVEIEDPDDPDARLAFALRFEGDGDDIDDVSTDAPLEAYSDAQSDAHAMFLDQLLKALAHERIGLRYFSDVVAFLDTLFDVRLADDGAYEIDPDGNLPFVLRDARVHGEPWIWLGVYIGTTDELDHAWLAERSAEKTHLDAEVFDSGVYLSTAFPTKLLTGARVLDLMQDLVEWEAELDAACGTDVGADAELTPVPR